MRTHGPHPLLRAIRRLATVGELRDATDAELLRAYVESRNEAAFELLVHRHALRARRGQNRQQARECPGVECVAAPSTENDLSPLLQAELQRLPDKYRAPIVLCYLEGQTNEEAARHLAWPVGTLKVRLLE